MSTGTSYLSVICDGRVAVVDPEPEAVDAERDGADGIGRTH